jgi:hypothetical protein
MPSHGKMATGEIRNNDLVVSSGSQFPGLVGIHVASELRRR